MNKHIFGFSLFTAIVVAFVFIYTVWYAPSIPPKEIVKPPLTPVETTIEKPFSCPSKKKNLAFEVISAQYFQGENKLVSMIKLDWNGAGAPPKRVFVQPRVFTIDEYRNAQFLSSSVVIEPFVDGNSRTVRVESRCVIGGAGTAMPNYYVFFDVSEDSLRTDRALLETDLTAAHQVLFAYTEQSSKRLPRGSSVPQ